MTEQGVTYNTFCLKRDSIMAGTGNELPDSFDVIVIGTGLEESMVAAAASRVGHTVLHLDPNDYYGADWAAFTFDGFRQWIQKKQQTEDDPQTATGDSTKVELQPGEELVRLVTKSNVSDAKSDWHVPDEEEEEPTGEADKNTAAEGDIKESKEGEDIKDSVEGEGEQDKDSVATQVPPPQTSPVRQRRRWPKHKTEANSRKFNLDLTPRLLYSRGAMVELLISSNISRYAEFKACSRVLTVKDGRLEHVPSSRADVFATKHVSVVEKRILMKFITFCVDFRSHPQIYEKFEGKTYLEFLKHEKLTSNLIEFVMSSIAMVDPGTDCLTGLEATQKFLTSIGRFGNTPFLWSMYGSGELPQAFCRLAAVFGATYFLGRPLDGVVVDADGAAVGVAFNGKRIGCKHLVADSRLFPENKKKDLSEWRLARRVCLLEDSIMPAEKEQLTFVSLPPIAGKESHYTYVQEVGFGTAACPKSMYVLHMTSRDVAADALEESRVLQDPSRLIWSATWSVRAERARPAVGNVHFVSGPSFELDYDEAIGHARRVFADMFGQDAEFLPRAPDPEEIVIGGGETNEQNDQQESNEKKQAANESTNDKDQSCAESNQTANQNEQGAVEESTSDPVAATTQDS